jgi:hypothetical protein
MPGRLQKRALHFNTDANASPNTYANACFLHCRLGLPQNRGRILCPDRRRAAQGIQEAGLRLRPFDRMRERMQGCKMQFRTSAHSNSNAHNLPGANPDTGTNLLILLRDVLGMQCQPFTDADNNTGTDRNCDPDTAIHPNAGANTNTGTEPDTGSNTGPGNTRPFSHTDTGRNNNSTKTGMY